MDDHILWGLSLIWRPDIPAMCIESSYRSTAGVESNKHGSLFRSRNNSLNRQSGKRDHAPRSWLADQEIGFSSLATACRAA